MAKKQQNNDPQAKQFEEKVVQVSRVSKKTKGGNKFGFSVLMVVGDRQGNVGVGLGKAHDVLSAIRKGVRKAKKKMITVPMNGATIPFPIEVKHGAARLILKPAPRGSGVIAGGPIRAVVDAAGIRDISSKILGTSNQASNVYATFEALQQIHQIVRTKDIKLKSIAQEEKEEKLKELEEQRLAKEKATQAHESEAPEKKTAKKPAAVKKAPAKKPAAKVKKVEEAK
jgi:small subunit ribosomal protein S5